MKGAEVAQADLEALVLGALFDYAQSASTKLNAVEVAKLLGGEFSESRVRMALRTLDNLDDVDAVHSGYSGSSYEISEQGYKRVEKVDPTVGSAPASDRIVPLNHNSPEYQSIKAGLDELAETIRGSNDVGESLEERDRLLQSLVAARELWAAAELQLVQIKVGVILAIENAGKALTKIGKSVGWAVLIESEKEFVKNKIGLSH